MKKQYIPALVVLALVLGYEIFAAITNVVPTWSEVIWHFDNTWPWFAWVVIAITVVLLGHFFLRWWGPARKR